jgi:hypothetical protein
LSASGSRHYPPLRSILRPCRIVIVTRTASGYEVRGETHLEGQPAVTWRVQTFAIEFTRSREQAEKEANEAAARFAASTPAGFKGQVYVVDCYGKIIDVPRRDTSPW